MYIYKPNIMQTPDTIYKPNTIYKHDKINWSNYI